MPFSVTSRLAEALYEVMTHPEYDHKRMIDKITKYGGSQLREWRTVKDWARNLEDVYNLGQGQATRVRFF
jgi:hypothetical protein